MATKCFKVPTIPKEEEEIETYLQRILECHSESDEFKGLELGESGGEQDTKARPTKKRKRVSDDAY